MTSSITMRFHVSMLVSLLMRGKGSVSITRLSPTVSITSAVSKVLAVKVMQHAIIMQYHKGPIKGLAENRKLDFIIM